MPRMMTYPMATLFWPSSTWSDGPNVVFSLARIQADALKSTLRYQIEALRFMKSRCEQDLRFLENTWSPDHVNDRFDLWCSFWQDTFLDYSQEPGRIAEIGSSVAVETAQRVHGEEKLLAENLAVRTVM